VVVLRNGVGIAGAAVIPSQGFAGGQTYSSRLVAVVVVNSSRFGR
jgi:hypothetical protein